MAESERAIEILEDIRRWVKIMGTQESKSILNGILTDEDNEDRQKALRIAYHLTDGSNSNDDIAEYIQYSSEFVRLRQNEWADLGLLERDSKNDPYTKILSLSEVGIEVPEIPDPGE